jgi:hypothetical protein
MLHTEKTSSGWVWETALSNMSLECVRLLRIYEALLEDFGCSQRTFEYIKDRVFEEGLPFLTCELPRLGKHFEFCLEAGHWLPYPHMKKVRGGFPPVCASEIEALFDNLEGHQSHVLVRTVRQICYFAYKAMDSRGITLEQERQAVINYKALEAELPTEFPWDPLLGVCNLLAREIFKDFSFDDLRFRHGPGTVSDSSFSRKFSCLTTSSTSTGRMTLFNDFDHLVEDVGRTTPFAHHDYFRVKQVSEFLCVPKDSRGPRTICRESANNQFIQQGIRGFMETALESHPLSKGHVNFKDQSVNANFALTSSSTRDYSTIDLSDASDRLTLALFEKVFADTAIGTAILNSRSTHVQLPDGIELMIRKLSPMGSAVCFTTLGFTIWALLFAGLSLAGRSDLARDVYVYGDDIVVPSECHTQATAILQSYGLKVNIQKSFVRSLFRESCGTDAYNGANVTPVRLRYHMSNDHLTNPTNRLASFAATIHQLWGRGYFSAAYTMASMIPELPPGTVDSPYLSLPVELVTDDVRTWFLVRGYKGCLDDCGRLFVKYPTYNIRSEKAKTAESPLSFFYRSVLPNAGKNFYHPDWDDDDSPSPIYGVVELPRKTRIVRSKRRIYLDSLA